MEFRSYTPVHCEATLRSEEAEQARKRWFEEGANGYLPREFHSPVEIVEDPFSLDNLRYREPVTDEERTKQILVTPDLIRSFVDRINELPDEGKPFVIGIGTGGTPSMDNHDTGGALASKFGFSGLMNHRKIDPRLQEEFDIVGVDLFKTDSSQLEIDDVGDMIIAKAYIWKNMRPSLRERFYGFITIHGTDTMSPSGAHSATMLGKGMPFNDVYVGAQRSIGDKRTDFPQNLEDAFDTIKILNESGLAECVTVMGRRALLTIGSNKVSGERLDAFVSPRHPMLIDFTKVIKPDEYRIRAGGAYREKESGIPFEPVVYRGPDRIEEIPAKMSKSLSSVIATVRFSAAKAILLVPYQGGTYDAQALRYIAMLAEHNPLPTQAEQHITGQVRPHDIPIFAVHPSDEETDLKRYDAALAAFANAGVVPLNMTLSAANAKIMRAIALSDEADPAYKRKLEAAVSTDSIGETSYPGHRYLAQFDMLDIDALERTTVATRLGTPCFIDIFDEGDNALFQFRHMQRGSLLVANTRFLKELFEEVSRWARRNMEITRGTKSWIPLTEEQEAEIEAMNANISEIWIPQIVEILNDIDLALTFMRDNEIEVNLPNYLQLREEMLVIWSHLTSNNLTYRRGREERYVPLVGPDSEGMIRRIDHEQRILEEMIAFARRERV